MKSKCVSFIGVILLLTSSCSTYRKAPVTTSGKATSPASYNPTAVSGISYLDHPFDTGAGAYGYLLIKHPTSSEEGKRFDKLANNFYVSFLTFDYAVKQGIPTKDLLITYWLFNQKLGFKIQSYEDIKKNYDFQKSMLMLTSIPDHVGNGPYLIAWVKPYSELDVSSSKKYLLFDLSNFSDKDLNRALQIWQRMLSDTSNWNSKYDAIIKFREAVRNAFEKYGACIFGIISDEHKAE